MQGILLTSAIPFALLLQAQAEQAVETAVAAAQETMAPVESTGLLSLLLNQSLLASIVLLILLCLSILSWTIAVSKYNLLKRAGRNDLKFMKQLRRAGQLADLNASSEHYRPAPLVTVFEFGYEEVARQVNTYARLRNPSALERSLQLGISEEVAHLQRHLGWLATTASASPFIGLFGTVWGVLEAFRGLGQAGGATLRAVEPGIAEALIATAAGLFAAIPALFFYNHLSQRIREIRTRMDDFSLEFFNLAERNYGETDGVYEPQRATRGVDR
jgi:biopolymer transport protein TolQ